MSRKLDALVAEQVMGLVPDGPGVELKSYSTDISAAWQVAEKVLEMAHPCSSTKDWERKTIGTYGFRLERECENQAKCGVWFCQFPYTTCCPPHEEMNEGVSAKSRSAPMAICLAALKACGCEYIGNRKKRRTRAA